MITQNQTHSQSNRQQMPDRHLEISLALGESSFRRFVLGPIPQDSGSRQGD
jgi:hypothetical protein